MEPAERWTVPTGKSRAGLTGRSRTRGRLAIIGLLFFGSVVGGAPSAKPEISATVQQGATPLMAETASPGHVTEEMRAWVRRAVPRTGPPTLRAQRLLAALQALGGRGLEEVSGHTATASEAFATRRADCVAFALLVVGLARELEVPAYFVLTKETENYERSGDITLALRHLAAAYGPPDSTHVLDFRGLTKAPPGRFRRIPDRAATAIFCSNRGAQRLLAGETEAAVETLERAVATDPELEDAWVNLGVALRRAGRLDVAEAAYRRALAIDPGCPSAKLNLAFLRGLRAR